MICFNGLIYAQEEQSFQIISERKAVELSEIKINNNKIDSIIKENILSEEIDNNRKEYVYKVIFEQKSDNKFLMEISLVPPTLFNSKKNTRFFQVEKNYFILSGQFPQKDFICLENKKTFEYEELHVKYTNGISMDYYSRPEEFTTWLFSYEKGKVKFLEKYN